MNCQNNTMQLSIDVEISVLRNIREKAGIYPNLKTRNWAEFIFFQVAPFYNSIDRTLSIAASSMKFLDQPIFTPLATEAFIVTI